MFNGPGESIYPMDYVGFSVYNSILMGDRAALDQLSIHGEEPEMVFPGLLAAVDRLAASVEPHVRDKGIGTVIHFCDMRHLMSQDFVTAPWKQALRSHAGTSRFKFFTGAHINFNHGNLPLAPGFEKEFISALEYCKAFNVDAMVLHAPLVQTGDTDGDWARLMTSEAVTSAMEGCDTTLCWENAQDTNARYRLLENLVPWRRKLVSTLEKSGLDHLEERHQFCFDTGHFLLSLQRDGANEAKEMDYFDEFAKHVKVFHLQANDGTGHDQHLVPFLDLDTRKTETQVDKDRFIANSNKIVELVARCNAHAGIDDRHVHVEVGKPVFLEDMIAFYKRLYRDGFFQ